NKKSKNRIFKEATKLVKKLIYPQIQIKLRHNAKFTTKDLLDVLVHIAYSHDFTTNGSSTFQELNPNVNAPSGDLMLHHFSKFNSIEQIKEMFISIFDLIFNFAKNNYKFLNRRKVNIAYDIHKIPYYGDKNDPFVVEGKPERGTSHFYQFLTCSIVVAGHRFTIDAIPVLPFDDLEELLDKSLERVKNKVGIEKAYFDRGFDKPKLINIIKKHRIKFIMPKIRSATVKAWMRKSQDCEARIIKDFEIGEGESKAVVNLILVDDEIGIKRAFITNFDIPEQLTHHLYSWYSKRWGIETSYRNMDHDFKARTTSKNYHIRLFYFLFSVCLYNLWILVNICISISIYGRIREKPIITAKLFAVVLYKVTYEDPPT
ncbi:MAG: transposase, partial [Nanoarchaeota archaeon]